MSTNEATIVKTCRACGKTKQLSAFRYIRHFQEYRSICKVCEAQDRRKRNSERKKRAAMLRAQRIEAREKLRKDKNAKIVGQALGVTNLGEETIARIDAELRNLRTEYFKGFARVFLKRLWLVPLFVVAIFLIFYSDQFTGITTLMLVVAALFCSGTMVSYTLVLYTLKDKELLRDETQVLRRSLVEKSIGFPTLMEALKKYDEKKDEFIASYLQLKERPSVKASEVLREEARRRRDAESRYFQVKSIIDYYESIAPFLVDLKDDIVEDEGDTRYRDYDPEERDDPVTDYLTKEEYRHLTSAEKSQLALNRYWERPKSKRTLGRIYERYVGYLYEQQGYDVDYVGIFKGFEDLGRDLICRKSDEIIIIQCKNWSQFKTIYEKHVFQFFGTLFQYKDENAGRNVKGIFCTTTELSTLAHRFAEQLGIEIKDNFKFAKNYPSIKCNISRDDGSKIYHLPFDQQYDRVKVERDKGEFYCSTTQEAESKGFRRALKWRGLEMTVKGGLT